MELYGISIVIPTKGRIKLLEELLKSVYIARKNFSEESEVILVDDSDEKDVIEILKMCDKYSAHKIHYSPSVAEKRNIGARAAKYDIILYLDSDCIATPDLLNEHKKLYTNEKVGGVAGLLEFVGKDTALWEIVDKSPYVLSFRMPKWFDEVPWTPTANFSVRKDVFCLIGGFDRDFPDKPGGEDVDFGLTLTQMGFVIKCSKNAFVYHSKETWIPIKDMMKRLWHYGSANYNLVKKFPDRTYGALPKKPIIALIVFLVSTLMALETPWLLLLFPLWLVIDNAFTALMFYRYGNHNNSTAKQVLGVQLMICLNESGYIWRCFVKRRIFFVFRDFIYFDHQLEGVSQVGAISTWCNFITQLIIFLIIFMVL